MAKLPKISEQLREIINDSYKTKRALCDAIKMNQTSLSHFLNGSKGLSMKKIDAIGVELRIELLAKCRIREKTAPKGKGADNGKRV